MSPINMYKNFAWIILSGSVFVLYKASAQSYQCTGNDVCSISGTSGTLTTHSGVDCGASSICRIACDVADCFGIDPFTINMQQSANLELIFSTENSARGSVLLVNGGTGIDFDISVTATGVSFAPNSATIDAGTADNLYVTAGAQYGFVTTTIYTPNQGDAFISMTEQKALAGMTVIAGAEANGIYIDCGSTTTNHADNCADITVNAESAQYLELKATVSSSGMGGGSAESNVITCPRDSSYRHPEYDASCALLTGNGGIIKKMQVRAKDGFPQNVYLSPDSTISELKVKCGTAYLIESFIQQYSEYTDTSQECYLTYAPTSTPTSSPTSVPTQTPTTTAPTRNPTQSSTDSTPTPTTTPTSTPTRTPTSQPSVQPSETPTTAAPTRNPTQSPTTAAPTSTPTTSLPTESPTDSTPTPTNTPTSATHTPTSQPSEPPTTSDPSSAPAIDLTAPPILATQYETDGDSTNDDDNTDTQQTQPDFIYIGAPLLICLCVCALSGWCFYRRHKRVKQRRAEEQIRQARNEDRRANQVELQLVAANPMPAPSVQHAALVSSVSQNVEQSSDSESAEALFGQVSTNQATTVTAAGKADDVVGHRASMQSNLRSASSVQIEGVGKQDGNAWISLADTPRHPKANTESVVQLQMSMGGKKQKLSDGDDNEVDEDEMEMMYDENLKIESEMTTGTATAGLLPNASHIQDWLELTVQVSPEYVAKYVEYFTSNGYGSLERIRDIESESQLKQIGIDSVSHKVMIMVHILQLKQMAPADLRAGITGYKKVENNDGNDECESMLVSRELAAAEAQAYGNMLSATPQPLIPKSI